MSCALESQDEISASEKEMSRETEQNIVCETGH